MKWRGEDKYNISKLDYATVDNPFARRVICGHCGSNFEEGMELKQ